jgi:hypothetical protein
MDKVLISFYDEYVKDGLNISLTAEKNGITNTECNLLVKMGKRLSEAK